MSQIINKAFDASKKIIRSIFKGSPNLFTSADLNRQIEAIKYQLDLLDDKTGFVSDINLSNARLSNGNLSVTPVFTFLKYRGCDFRPASKLLQINVSSKPAYLALFAKTTEVTYEMDSSHEIAGAKFADGTSQPSANQLVYTDEKLALIYADYKPNVAVDGVLLGVIAMFQETQGTLIVKKNYSTGITDVLSFRTDNNVVNSDTGSIDQIKPGTSYDQAINILQNRLNKLKNDIQTSWTPMTIASQGQYDRAFSAEFRITDGVLQIKTTIGEMSYSASELTNHVALCRFPLPIATKLKNYFKELTMLYGTRQPTAPPNFIPFGDVRPAIAISRNNANNNLNYHQSQLMGISLLVFDADDSRIPSDDYSVILGAYSWARFIITSDSVTSTAIETPMSGLNSEVWTGSGKLYLPAMFISIPLPGFNW